jgi:hypothetical protein
MKKEFPGVRKDTLDTINNFVTKGWEPGSFVRAVLENNLMDALGQADRENRFSIFEICSYVYNEIPLGAHGSAEKVKQWQEMVRKKNLVVKALD